MRKLTDTSPEAQRVLTEAYRAMPPERKLQLLVQDYRLARSLHEAGVRQRNPQATASEVRDSWVSMMLGAPPRGLLKKDGLMDRDVENLDIVREVIATFDRLTIPYVLGGSWASSLHGEPRTTRDADMTAEPFPGREDQFVGAFGPDYYVSLDAVRQANRERSTFNVINTLAAFKVDVFIRKDRPFEQSLMQRRLTISPPGSPGPPIAVATPEDIILLKLEWYRLGGEVSDRQWTDVLGVLRTQAGRLDEDYLGHWAKALGVEGLWTRAREEAGS